MISSYELPGSSRDLIPRKSRDELPEFDITAMVDLVFMMNIYFLVTFVTVALSEIDLPTANRVSPLDADEAVQITISAGIDGRSTTVALGEAGGAIPLRDDREQELKVREFVEQGQATGKTSVLLKAERRVRLRDLFRIASASAIDGMKLNVAVHEKDSAP